VSDETTPDNASTSATSVMTIGEFGRRSNLSPKALRLYEREGLLHPVRVDEHNGYRWYAGAQLETARLIGLLRGLDMSLDDIALLLADTSKGSAARSTRLSVWWRRSERDHTSRRRLLEHITQILNGDTTPMYEIQTRHIPAARVMSVQRKLLQPALFDFIIECRHTFADHLASRPASGPFTVVFHGMCTFEENGPVEIFMGCPDDVQPSDAVGVRVEPAHDEAFTRISLAQLQFPELLGIYDAVACSPEVTGHESSALSCREVYFLDDPSCATPDEPFCDIAFPIGPEPHRDER